MELYKRALEKGRVNYAKIQTERDTLREKFLQFAGTYGPGEFTVDCVGRLMRAGNTILTVTQNEPKTAVSGVSIYPLIVTHNESHVRVEMRCVEEVEPKLAELLEHPCVVHSILKDEERLLMK